MSYKKDSKAGMLESQDTRVKKEKLDQLTAAIPLVVISTSVLVLLNAYALYLYEASTELAAWFVISMAITMARLQHYLRYQHDKSAKTVQYWQGMHYLHAALSGSIWGYAVLFLMPENSLAHQFTLTITAAGMVSGGSSTLSLQPRIFYVFMAVILIPMSIRLFMIDPEYSWILASLCYFYMYFIGKTCQRNYHNAHNNIVKTFSLADQQQALDDSLRRLDIQINSSPLGVIEWSPALTVKRCNPAAELTFGYSKDQWALTTDDLVFEDENIIEHLKNLGRNSQPISETLVNKTVGGEVIHCDWTSTTLLDDSGELLGYTSFIRDVSERIAREALIKKQAHYDAVTGLANRYHFQEHLAQELSRVSRGEQYSALLFIDLDNFKHINDSLGHTAGDDLLRQFGQRLQGRFRQHEMVARFGGDEFVILLANLGDKKDQAKANSAHIASALQQALQDPFILEDNQYVVSCSIGITLFNNDDKGKDEILKEADLALYESKGKGRNTYNFFADNMGNKATRHLQMVNSLRGAISRDEMWLVYQPKATIAGQQLMGAEVLIRWKNETFGFVSPAEFIPIIENSSLMSELGFWVIEQSAKQLKQWLQQGVWPKSARLSINLSPRQLIERGFVEKVAAIAAAQQLDCQWLEFEITENVLVHNTETVEAVLNALTELGFSFSIDDFGTGYSSLAYLKQLPINVLKIDKSFVDHVCESDNDRAIVKSMLSICKELQLTSVAEGVETEQQRQRLEQLGCDLLQGYLYSKPIDCEAMGQLLAEQQA